MAKNKDEKAHADETLEIESSESRVYELGFHLDPELPIEEVKKAYQTIKGVIAEKGTLVAESEPVKIQLAYTISRQEVAGRRDFDSAYFSWVVYETPAENHAEILQIVNKDKRIVRFIDLSTTKDAARHSVELRELSMKTPMQAEDSEAVLGTELDAALESVTI
jgi:ribosomal protein S6